jgi:hypothetical protein
MSTAPFAREAATHRAVPSIPPCREGSPVPALAWSRQRGQVEDDSSAFVAAIFFSTIFTAMMDAS